MMRLVSTRSTLLGSLTTDVSTDVKETRHARCELEEDRGTREPRGRQARQGTKKQESKLHCVLSLSCLVRLRNRRVYVLSHAWTLDEWVW